MHDAHCAGERIARGVEAEGLLRATADAIFRGLDRSVREMRSAIERARG